MCKKSSNFLVSSSIAEACVKAAGWRIYDFLTLRKNDLACVSQVRKKTCLVRLYTEIAEQSIGGD